MECNDPVNYHIGWLDAHAHCMGSNGFIRRKFPIRNSLLSSYKTAIGRSYHVGSTDHGVISCMLEVGID